MKSVSVLILLSIFAVSAFAQGLRCPSPNFRCRRIYAGTDNCIAQKLFCDGIEDCQDGSDEDPNICARANRRACTYNEFRCENGACINSRMTCNGRADCTDGSDEHNCGYVSGVHPLTGGNDDWVRPSATINDDNKPETTPKPTQRPSTERIPRPTALLEPCLSDEFQCDNGHCINQDVICNGVRNCTDGSDESPQLCREYGDVNHTIDTTTSKAPVQPSGTSWQPKNIVPCFIPHDVENGEWKLDSSQCDNPDEECEVPWNVRTLNPGTLLIYSCWPGYALNGTSLVVCGPNGEWINEPYCEEIKCPGLSGSSMEALCTLDGLAVSCEDSVSVETTAQLTCRKGFVQETSFEPSYGDVECGPEGKWEPNPIKCVRKPRRVKLVLEGDMSMLDPVE